VVAVGVGAGVLAAGVGAGVLAAGVGAGVLAAGVGAGALAAGVGAGALAAGVGAGALAAGVGAVATEVAGLRLLALCFVVLARRCCPAARADRAPKPSAARVRGPTTPSAFRWWRCCARRTAARVRGPKRPSAPLAPTLYPRRTSARWSSRTRTLGWARMPTPSASTGFVACLLAACLLAACAAAGTMMAAAAATTSATAAFVGVPFRLRNGLLDMTSPSINGSARCRARERAQH
jgi:hypothetical protein